jgi:hypothetical protein
MVKKNWGGHWPLATVCKDGEGQDVISQCNDRLLILHDNGTDQRPDYTIPRKGRTHAGRSTYSRGLVSTRLTRRCTQTRRKSYVRTLKAAGLPMVSLTMWVPIFASPGGSDRRRIPHYDTDHSRLGLLLIQAVSGSIRSVGSYHTIVNVSSAAGVQSNGTGIVSKATMNQMTRSRACE